MVHVFHVSLRESISQGRLCRAKQVLEVHFEMIAAEAMRVVHRAKSFAVPELDGGDWKVLNAHTHACTHACTHARTLAR